MTSIHFPIRLLTVACLLTIIAFAGFGWNIFDARRDTKMFRDRLSRIEELRGVIVHLDEVLTMSARMAATTGDSRLEERYHHFEPQLDAAIKEIIRIGATSSDIKAATKTNAANIKLVEMENRAFGLVRAGRKEEAHSVLFSPEYERQKQIYAEGTLSFVDQVRREFDENFQHDQRFDLLLLIGAAAVGGTSFVAWFCAARGVRRWRAQLLDSVNRRGEAEENLRKAHSELEVRVEERTAELARANEALQAENSERKQAEEALRESKHFAESIAENSTSIIYLFDLETRRNAYSNRSLGEFLGYSQTQILELGDNIVPTIIHPEDLPRIEQHLGRFAEVTDSRVLDIEYRVKHASGDWHWIWARETVFNRRPNGIAWQILGTAQDITDRKKTERALGESEERFRLVARATDDAIWDWDIIANTISFSESLGTLFGYQAGEFDPSREFWMNGIHPDDRAEVMSSLHKFFATRDESWSSEYRFRCADGCYAFVFDRGYVVRDSEGKPLRMAGAMMDITERKQAEMALSRLAAIVESSGDAIIGKDLNGIITSWNKGAEEIFGYEASEMMGASIMRLIPTDRQDEEDRIKEKVRHGENVERFETLRQTKDGRLIDVSVTASPIKDTTGQVIGVSKVARDITEHKRTEAQRERLAALVEASPDFIGYADPKTAQIKYINKQGRRMCGIGEDEDIGKVKISDVHPAWMNKRFAEVIMPAAIHDGLWEGEGAFLSRDGREIPVLMTLLAQKAANGEVDIFYTVSRDITERKRAEKELHWKTALLQAQVDSGLDGILVVDEQGKQILRNERFNTIWKIPPNVAEDADDRETLELVRESDKKSQGVYRESQRPLLPPRRNRP